MVVPDFILLVFILPDFILVVSGPTLPSFDAPIRVPLSGAWIFPSAIPRAATDALRLPWNMSDIVPIDRSRPAGCLTSDATVATLVRTLTNCSNKYKV